MCPPKAPKIPEPETITYAPPAPEPEKAPVLKDTIGKDRTASTVTAKRRGTRALRTDLGIPGTGGGSTGSKGLNIPS